MSNDIKKNNSGIIKIRGLFVLIMLVSIFAVGCSKQNNGLVTEQSMEEADYYTVKDIELCDNWIYYRLEANKKDPEAILVGEMVIVV